MGYYEDVFIDKNNLDEECVVTPTLYDHYSRNEQIALTNRDILKDKVPVIKARIELELRSKPVEEINKEFELQLKSVTEATVKALVEQHPLVIQALKEYHEAKADAANFKTSRKSMSKKHSMLETLAYLHSSGYFMRVEGSKPEVHKLQARKFREKLGEAIDAVRFEEGLPHIDPDRLQQAVERAKQKKKPSKPVKKKMAREER